MESPVVRMGSGDAPPRADVNVFRAVSKSSLGRNWRSGDGGKGGEKGEGRREKILTLTFNPAACAAALVAAGAGALMKSGKSICMFPACANAAMAIIRAAVLICDRILCVGLDARFELNALRVVW